MSLPDHLRYLHRLPCARPDAGEGRHAAVDKTDALIVCKPDPCHESQRRLPTYIPGERPPLGQVRVFEADPTQPHRSTIIARHVGGWRYQPVQL